MHLLFPERKEIFRSEKKEKIDKYINYFNLNTSTVGSIYDRA
jgi:hypothetical protein